MGRERASHNLFIDQIRVALSHYHDPFWLGQHSPLASVYFLSQFLPNETGLMARGKALQLLIDNAATRLWGDEPLPADRDALFQACEAGYDKRKSKSNQYRYTLLELCYFRRYVPADMYPRDRGECQLFLEVGRNPFYEHLNKTIVQLSEILLTLVQPTFRLETPTTPHELIGRKVALQQCLRLLHSGTTVAINGTSGAGKTRLGLAVRDAWAGEVFWLTFRPKVNDTLSSVIFTLAHYLHSATQGNSLLWQQMMADKGSLQQQSVWPGLLRRDLKQLDQHPPLLCFDNVDLLRMPYLADIAEQQQAVLTLIESVIAENVPVLLIGQQIPLTIENHVTPDALTLDEATQFLGHKTLGKQDIAQLLRVTRGNPRAMRLCAALLDSGESVAEIVARFPHYPSVQSLLDRLWARLNKDERQVLAALSVYRSVVPTDLWANYQSVIDHLSVHGLIEHDRAGGLLLAPTVADLVYGNLARELRDRYHSEAATLRAQRGEYTAAAFHFYRAGKAGAAVDVWYQHADLEMARGQAAAARAVFDDVSMTSLDPQQRAQLLSIRNRLALLLGDARRVLADAATGAKLEDSELSAEIAFQQGQANELLGDLDNALEQYTQAVATTARLLRNSAEIAHKKVWLQLRASHFDEAQQEASLAKCYAEFSLGNVCHHRGDYANAREHFQSALTLAQMLEDKELIPKLHRRLSNVAGHLSQIDVAQHHGKQAMAGFHKIGDVLRVEWMRADLAGMQLQVGNYAAVLESAEKALRFFEQINNVEAISATLCNLAEAHLELGNLDRASDLALRVLQLEEPYYQPYAHYTLGLACQRSQAIEQAIDVLQQGIQHASNDRFIHAYLQGALGRTYLLQNSKTQAIAHLTMAQEAFSAMGLEQERIKITQLIQANQE